MHPIWCLTGGFKHVGPATKRLQRNASLDMLPMATWAKRLFLNESTKKGTFLFNKVYWLVLGLSEKDGRHWQSSNRRQRNPMKPATSCGKPRLMRQGKGLLFPSVVHLPWFRGLDFEAPHNIHTFPKNDVTVKIFVLHWAALHALWSDCWGTRRNSLWKKCSVHPQSSAPALTPTMVCFTQWFS